MLKLNKHYMFIDNESCGKLYYRYNICSPFFKVVFFFKKKRKQYTNYYIIFWFDSSIVRSQLDYLEA